MVAPLYTDISAGIRAMLDDQTVPGGATFTDAYNQKYIEQANQTLVEILVSNSVERMKLTTETPITVNAGITILDHSAAVGGQVGTGIANVLPDDFILPDQMFEAKAGATAAEFIAMTGPVQLPNLSQSDVLTYWDWYGGQIHLVGSTATRLVKIIYWSQLAAVDPAGRLKVVAAGPALLALACHYILRSRGSFDMADRFAKFNDDQTITGEAGFHIGNIVNQEIKAMQSQPQRRQPYFGRDRYSSQSYQVRSRR
jgi:hypothetical protein